jgi:hypothetical protein
MKRRKYRNMHKYLRALESLAEKGCLRRFIRLSFWYFLRWLRGPIQIAQGMAQALSLGCWEPSWVLKMEGWFLDYSWEVRDLLKANR